MQSQPTHWRERIPVPPPLPTVSGPRSGRGNGARSPLRSASWALGTGRAAPWLRRVRCPPVRGARHGNTLTAVWEPRDEDVEDYLFTRREMNS